MKISNILNLSKIVIAHRGDSVTETENTLKAFHSAHRKGAHILETDVHITRDGKVLIWHDESLASFSETGTGEIFSTMDYKDIAALGRELTGEAVPLLSDLLEEIPDVCINIDLKDRRRDLIDAYIDVLKAADARDRIITGSFHSGILCQFRKQCPGVVTSASPAEVKRILVAYYTGMLRLIPDLSATILQVPEIHGSLRVVSKGLVKLFNRKGGKIHVWTVNNREDMERLFSWGVHGIVTDDPGTALSLIN